MVDIIIPAYNCSKTLPRLLASIGAQTQSKKCIVTIVDDCSTEDIKPIIKDFKKYFNIKLQYIRLEENLRWPGLVRQVGLERTNAPYVMFLDSDDFLSPRAVELANREMRSTNADMIIGHFYGEDHHNRWNLFNEDMTTWLHGNIYKRSFLQKNNIYFEPFYNEDGAFNTECMLLADKMAYITEPIYFWSYNTSSVTKEEFFKINNYPFFVMNLEKAYKKVFNKNSKNNKIFKNIGEHIFRFYQYIDLVKYLISHKEDKAEDICEKMEESLRSFSNFLLNQNFSKEQKNIILENFIFSREKTDKKEGDYLSIQDFWEDYGFELVFGGINLYESSNN